MKYNIENYRPLPGKLVIKPLKMRTRLVKNIVLDDEKNEGKDPLKDEVETKVVTERAPWEIQLATIVAVPEDSELYKVGDTVVYSVKFVKEFDLFKGTFIVSNYDLYGTYKIN